MRGKAFEVTHTDAEWRRLLTPEQYRVMRAHGTEPAGSCALNHEKRPGVSSAPDADSGSSPRTRNSIVALVGQASTILLKARLRPLRTKATAWRGPRRIAADAEAIWAMSF
jgi:hypothetical protein